MSKKERIFSVKGMSSSGGFELTVKRLPRSTSWYTSGQLRTETVATSGHLPDEDRWAVRLRSILGNPLIAVFWAGMELFGILLIAALTPPKVGGIALMSFATCNSAIYAYVVYVMCYQRLCGSKKYGWHGAEHKAAQIIEFGYEPSAENFELVPKEHSRCGGVGIPGHFFYGIIVGFTGLLLFFGIIPGWMAVGILVGESFAQFILDSALGYPSGKLFQKFISTEEPNAEQIQEAIRVVEKAYNALYYSPRQG